MEIKKLTEGENNICIQKHGVCKFHVVNIVSKIEESTAPEKDVLNKMIRNRDAVIKEMQKHKIEITAAINKIDQGKIF